jgi:hypothetical protein
VTKPDSDVAFFCPECGSPSLTLPILSGGVVICDACEWRGSSDSLLATPFSHELGSREDIMKALMGDLRVVLAKDCAGPLGEFLLKWGFLDAAPAEDGSVTLNPRQLGRYMASVARAFIVTIIEERQKMEKERAHGS